MNPYLLFLETLYAVTKKIRVEGVNAIVKHVDDPARSPFFSAVVSRQPESTFLCDSLRMMTLGLSLEELTFYMDGYRQRMITHDKADIHLVNVIFRSIWAIAHSSWDPLLCTEFGRAVIPGQHSMARKDWIAYCNNLEVERTQTNLDWDTLLKEIKTPSGT